MTKKSIKTAGELNKSEIFIAAESFYKIKVNLSLKRSIILKQLMTSMSEVIECHICDDGPCDPVTHSFFVLAPPLC